jgi:putative sterol carrier protein
MVAGTYPPEPQKKDRTMTSVADAIQSMKAKFNPSAAAGLDLVFGFRIDEETNYSLIVKDGTCDVKEGENPDAQVTLVMDSETLKGIVSGETDGMQAFMSGKLRTEGDMMLAMKLSELFPS